MDLEDGAWNSLSMENSRRNRHPNKGKRRNQSEMIKN